MPARLQYAKVIDSQRFYILGGKLHPGLDNETVVTSEPGLVGAFMIFRGWSNEHGTFTEQWRIESPGGSLLYTSTERELHIASDSHLERLQDEVSDLEVDYAAEDYSVVFRFDERDVARVSFPIRVLHTDSPAP
jgi:hypothetical protein